MISALGVLAVYNSYLYIFIYSVFGGLEVPIKNFSSRIVISFKII